ncbi:MAG: indolepyruvate oxidoreductase subunit beta [Desulfurococcales archaeon]|nr:indolepyruvate oxidoreductase subunit beta [Desulfurococcales archaeon]
MSWTGVHGVLNIVIVGVGGQGIITAAKVLSEAAMRAGHRVLVAETHGLSQRGGSVIVHVRLGRSVEAPLVPRGRADLMIAMEVIEALRYADYLNQDGYIIVDRQVIPPPLPGIGYIGLDEMLSGLRSLGSRVYDVDASKTAIEYGEPRAVNMYLLGFTAGLNGYKGMISIDDLRSAVSEAMRNAEVNLRVLERGYRDALTHNSRSALGRTSIEMN